MKPRNHVSICRRLILVALPAVFVAVAAFNGSGHPLGNFTINHYSRIEVASDDIRVHAVIDMAEIPAFQELQQIGSANNGQPSANELDRYARRAADHVAAQLLLSIDGARVPLTLIGTHISLPAGAGGLQTLRLELDLAGRYSPANSQVRELKFADNNYAERTGWREI